jgi:hypothetical protein
MDSSKIDISQELTDVENSLRDFISLQLSAKIGANWIEKCGIPEERLIKWNERKTTEQKRQQAGSADTRLIYYSDFYDLKIILSKNWDSFSDALGDLKTFQVLLT